MKLAVAIPSVGVLGLLLVETVVLRGSVFLIEVPILTVGISLLLMGIGAVYGLVIKRSPRLAFLAWFWGVYFLTIVTGALLPFACALYGRPDITGSLVAADRALGLDWPAYARYLFFSSGRLGLFLLGAYNFFPLDGLILVCFLSVLGSSRRMAEYILLFFLSVSLSGVLFGLFPAAIAPTGYGTTEFAPFFPFAPVIQAVIANKAVHLDQIIGLVSFPSFHTAGVILISYVYRRTVLFLPALVVNMAILVAVPAFGGHYFVDVLAGAAVAALAIVASLFILPSEAGKRGADRTGHASNPSS